MTFPKAEGSSLLCRCGMVPGSSSTSCEISYMCNMSSTKIHSALPATQANVYCTHSSFIQHHCCHTLSCLLLNHCCLCKGTDAHSKNDTQSYNSGPPSPSLLRCSRGKYMVAQGRHIMSARKHPKLRHTRIDTPLLQTHEKIGQLRKRAEDKMQQTSSLLREALEL
jgi:hypothetical protein